MDTRTSPDLGAVDRLPLGAFALDLVQGELLDANGRPAPLRRQALAVLRVLGERAGQVVGKDDLMRLVWPDVVVGEGSLAAAVADIRRVLGDDDHSRVRNVARRGYMLVPQEPAVASPAPAAGGPPAGQSAGSPGTPSAGSTEARRPRIRAWPALVACLLACLLAGLVAAAVWLPVHRPAASAADARPTLSLVVLPLATQGPADTAWFADALLGELITEVSRIYDTMVISRDTALTYRDRQLDPREVARELRVRWVVRGSVRYADGRVQLNLSLVDGESGAERWVDSLAADRAELPRLLGEFTQRLARLLVNEIYQSNAARAARLTPAQVTADDLAMQGIALWQRGMSRANVLAAMAFFDRAVAADPANLHGWGGVGYTRLHADMNGWLSDSDAARRRIAEAGARIEAIDPESFYGFQARVIAAFRQKDWPRMLAIAESWTQRQRHAHAFGSLGPALFFNDRPDEAIVALEQALRMSPRESFRAVWQNRIALAHYIAGRPALARQWSEDAQRTNPSLSWPPIHAAVLAESGEREAAQRAWDEFAARHPAFDSAVLLGHLPGTTPRYVEARERIVAALRSLGMR